VTTTKARIGGMEIADTSANSSTFTGKISGFGGINHSNHQQLIDLVSVTSPPNTISLNYISAASHASGTLSVSNGGAVVVAINMIGAYTSANFSARADGSGNVEIFDPAVPNGGSAVPRVGQSLPWHGLDLPSIAFGAQTTLAFSQYTGGAGGTLTMNDGRRAGSIALLVNYMAGSFVAVADGGYAGHRSANRTAAIAGTPATSVTIAGWALLRGNLISECRAATRRTSRG
jgi:hypothetical protein